MNITLEALGDTLYLKTTGSKDYSKRVTVFTIAACTDLAWILA